VSVESRTEKCVIDFDQHSPSFADRLKESFPDALREIQGRCPVGWTEAHGGYWVMNSHQAIADSTLDWEVFSSENDIGEGPRGGIHFPASDFRHGMAESDPPRHRDVRRSLNPWFSTESVRARVPGIRRDATWVLDQVVEAGAADFANDLAFPLPSMSTIRLMGLPFDEWRRYGNAMHSWIYVRPDSAERAAVATEMTWVMDQIAGHAEARRSEPTDDLLSFLANLEVQGELMTIKEIVDNSILLLIGGADTTTALLSNTFRYLSEHPATKDVLATASPRELLVASDEFLRYFPPNPGLGRNVMKTCVVGGQTLQAGERVFMNWAAGNYDPEVFEDPGEMRLDRRPNRHLAFGWGIHRCVGASMAREMWIAMVSEVLRRIPDFSLDLAAAQAYPTMGVNSGWISLPGSFTPAERIGALRDGTRPIGGEGPGEPSERRG
jgi:cytochrome P450